MRADPTERPPIEEIVNHTVVARARAWGKAALLDEDPSFLVELLKGMGEAEDAAASSEATTDLAGQMMDVEMSG
jgi:hypothetical protein